MKKISLMIAFSLLLCGQLLAQNTPITKSNYKLAERFSAPKVQKMVYSRGVTPSWLKDGNSFWYNYKTSEGLKFYLVNCTKNSKKELFDHIKMAAFLSEITGDPIEAKALPIRGIKFENDGKSFYFTVQSKKEIDKKLTKDEQKKEDEKKAKLEKDGKEYKAPKPKKVMKLFHFNYNLATGKTTELVDYEKEKEYPHWASVSPDGKIAVFAKGQNLYYMDQENLKKAIENSKDSTIVDYRLTTFGIESFGFGSSFAATKDDNKKDDKKDGKKDGKKDKEEDEATKENKLSRTGVNIVWSPDSKHFATTLTDQRMMKKLWVINSIANPRPTLESYNYQMPGEESPITYLYLFDITTKESKKIDISKYKGQMISVQTPPSKFADMYEYYKPSIWMGGNDFFYIGRTSRDHQRQDMSRVDIKNDTVTIISSTEMNVSLEERDLYMINNGKEHIVRSERDGWAHYYLYDDKGNVKNQITKGEYHADMLIGVDEKTRVMYFSAKGVNKKENPYYEHLCSIKLDGSDLKILNQGDFHFESSMNDNNTYFVSNYSRVDTTPKSALYNNKGKKVMDLETSDLTHLLASGYKFPERFVVKAADGVTDLYGVMYKPFDFDSTKLYPIIEYVYPGPQTEAVNEAFSPGLTRTDQLAQLGFIVITVGNRGGHSVRSKWYHTYGYGNFRDYGLADKKRAIEQLAARYNFIDISKVGIHGHSGGGFMSTAAMFVYPDFFKVAVSSAGNHDNRIYNRWWAEKHNGVTEKITEKEGEKSDTSFLFKTVTNPQDAKNLKGKLLLVHGEIDNNVHPANTMRVVDALIRANKRFDMLLLPTQRHGFGDMNEYFFWKMADYFGEHLIGDSKMNETHIPELSE